MKKYLPLLVILFLSIGAGAQSLSIFDAEGNDVTNSTVEVVGHPSDETITRQFDIFNSNDSNLVVDAIRFENNCISGSGEFFCWALCLAAEECGTSYERGMPFALTVDSNSFGNLPLVVDFEPSFDSDDDGLEGNASYTYFVYDYNNESDSAFVTVNYTIDYASGIKQYNSNSISEVYPNPANNTISVKINDQIENASFEVYSLVGTKVSSEIVKNQNNIVNIDVSSLPNGVYMLTEVQSQNTRRFIISR